jgi:hypothetical protein
MLSTLPGGPIRPGSEVTFTLDGETRLVSIAVDGAPQGNVFALPTDAELNAAAAAAAAADVAAAASLSGEGAVAVAAFSASRASVLGTSLAPPLL